MKTINQSFPHPVLGHNDDVSGIFKTDALKWSCDGDYFVLESVFELDNQTLITLISEKKAAFVMHVSCSNTFFRERFISYDKFFKQKIEAYKLRDKVEVSFYICVLEDISNYSISGAHSDYAGFSFDVEQGDILAYCGETSFWATKKYDELKAVGTIMQIISSGKKDHMMEISYDDDKIIIKLNEDDYNDYNLYKKSVSYEAFFHASIVLPVLVATLHLMKSSDDYSEQKWCQVIEARLTDSNVDLAGLDEVKLTELAQNLLGNPVHRMFNAINKLNEDSDNDE